MSHAELESICVRFISKVTLRIVDCLSEIPIELGILYLI